ncbi:MAG: YdcF family protein [Lachnospiraceae bacterium]|nr:YdcF family protein [Lachnospiraceae bacterium]
MKFIQDITEFVFVEHPPEKADIIFIPGSSHKELAVTAASLWRQGFAPWILPSGKYSKPVGHCTIEGFKTECGYLRHVLLEEGVPEAAILQEHQATYTYENAIYSRQVTDKAGLEIKKAILCPQAYHARRCLLYYEILYPDTTFFVCPTNTRGITRDNWSTQEASIDLVLGELERCGGQFHEILRIYGVNQSV